MVCDLIFAKSNSVLFDLKIFEVILNELPPERRIIAIALIPAGVASAQIVSEWSILLIEKFIKIKRLKISDKII